MKLVVAGWTCIFIDDRCLGEDLRFDLRWLRFTARRRMRRHAVTVPLSLSRVTIFVRLAIYYAKVMIRMLVIIFGHSVIARRVGVTGHRQVFFVHLMSISRERGRSVHCCRMSDVERGRFVFRNSARESASGFDLVSYDSSY